LHHFHVCCIPHSSHHPWFDRPNKHLVRDKLWSCSCSFLHPPFTSIFETQIFSSEPCIWTPSFCVPPLRCKMRFCTQNYLN
jgi:hypothetical protein